MVGALLAIIFFLVIDMVLLSLIYDGIKEINKNSLESNTFIYEIMRAITDRYDE